MLKKYYILLILILILFSFSVSNAQGKPLEYTKKITISNGLAHNGVTSMFEDSKGFLWFGTYDGINKYDGYILKTFKNTIDQDILTSNRVRAFNEDKSGNLWIGTDEGITIYSNSLEKFTKIYSNKLTGKGISGPIVRDIIVNREKGIILCATQANGILVFNTDHSLKKQYLPPNDFYNADILFFKGNQLDASNYIFSTSIGLIHFNSDTEQFKRVVSDAIDYSNSIIQIDEKTLLVTLSKGIALVELELIQNKFSFKVVQKSLESYQFNNAILDAKGKLWLSELTEGIIQVNNIELLKDEKISIKTFNDDLGILRGSSFLKTSNNSCWFATFNEGIYQFDINQNKFQNYNTEMDYKFGLHSNSVTHITPLDANRVYLSATLGGVALFDTQKQKFEPLPFNLPKGSNINTSAIFVDSRYNTWIRINNEIGLTRIKKEDKTLEKVVFNNVSLSVDLIIRSFSEDRYGNIWVGTNHGVYKISLNKSNEVLLVESLNNNPFFKANKLSLARFVYADPLHDYLWIGADSGGLFRIDNQINTPIDKLTVNQYVYDKSNKKSISSNFVTSIIRLPNEDFWIGTEGGGICKVLNSEGIPEFISFTEKNGLSNNVVKGLLYDNNYNLWVSTNIGLNLFNTQKNEFRKFNVSDGLAFEDFWFATNRLENGTLIMSGLDGFIYFNPNEIPNTEALPKVQFENFKIFNKNISPGDTIHKRVVLSKNISEVDEVILKHNENVFSVDFASLHYLNPKNHSLKYRLLPFNEQWIEVPSNQKTIAYNGLQPGTYKLSVMASNSLNDWTEPKTIDIIIKPSIWNTNLAYILYMLFGLLAAYTIVGVILKIQSLNHKVVIEQLEKDKVEEVNEAKLRFFANISHEIKTPLTLISRPLEVLKKTYRNNPDAEEKLNLITRQSKKIQQLIEQVQDFRKADVNLLKMDYSRFNFDAFAQELIVDFKFLADNDNKKIELFGDDSITMVSADKDKLEKIFNNLLNNAFKYTGTNDSIKVEFKKENDKDLIVKISDTGKGIDSEDLTHIFERFYQSKKKDNTHISGSGIGLAFSKRLVEMHYGFISAESTINEGTTITVRLPIVKKHLATDVLDIIELPKEKEVSVTSKIIKENAALDLVSSGDFKESVVFYAEDNLEMRNFVSNLLSKYFVVKSFRNGKECIDAMEDEWPDIVVSDVQMPEMNGLDLCLRIKSDLKTSHIPVILLTALTNIEDHLKGLRDGADAYIKKPFNVQHLITNVETLLVIRKQLRERFQVGIPLTKENNKNNRNDNAFLEKLYSLIEENLDNQEFDLNNLARELYLNRTHFYQKVKELTDQTPFELLKMYRLKKAAEFLAQKGMSVNDVFMMTGFKSRTHFTKVFKEKYNISPGKYASEAKNKISN
jgi:signal transduction histidine kinase/DNA-binding response OmpR family regulator/ligand-binding sensor domain-containing protein